MTLFKHFTKQSLVESIANNWHSQEVNINGYQLHGNSAAMYGKIEQDGLNIELWVGR